MTVSKRTRYEVLRRDDHTCRYCGAKAEHGPLTIDHVTPVALGGTDLPANLVTACRDCNAGKASTAPDASTVAGVEADAARWAEAAKAASAQLLREARETQAVREWFYEIWHEAMPPFALLPEPAEVTASLGQFVRAGLPPGLIEDAVQIAAAAEMVPQRSRYRYFCGICWNRIRDLEQLTRQYAKNGDVDDGT